MKPKLSPRENEVFDYIRDYAGKQGYPPKVREIQKALGIGSTSTVHRYLWKLVAKGYLVIEPGSARAIRVVA